MPIRTGASKRFRNMSVFGAAASSASRAVRTPAAVPAVTWLRQTAEMKAAAFKQQSEQLRLSHSCHQALLLCHFIRLKNLKMSASAPTASFPLEQRVGPYGIKGHSKGHETIIFS